jgi:hypothetical protein
MEAVMKHASENQRVVMMRKKPLRAVWTLSFLTPFIATPTVGDSANGPYYELKSQLSGQCLQPTNGSKDQGAAIVQEPCNLKPAQGWRAVFVGDNMFHYVNLLSGLCLDARGGAVNGTPVQQWPCNNITNENWEPAVDWRNHPLGPPWLISRVSGTHSHCLDVPGGNSTAGLAMQIYGCNQTLAQIWANGQIIDIKD